MVIIDLETSLTICRTFTGVIKDAFGPHGAKTMITTATGKILVTSDGSTILRALSLSHPLAKVIVTSAISHSNVAGSGTKTFVLYLNGALETVYHLSRKYCSHGENGIDSKAFILHLSDNIRKLITKHLAVELEDCLMSSKISGHFWNSDWRKLSEYLLFTELFSLLSPSLAEYLTHMLIGYLTEGVIQSVDVIHNARLVADNFHHLCAKIDGQGYKESCVTEGIIIKRDFTVYPSLPVKSPVKFIILNCSLDAARDGGTDSHRIQVNSEEILHKSLDQKQHKVDNFLTFCRKYEISVIVSSEKLLHSFIHKCRLYNIAVVEYVSDSDVDRLAMLCNIMPVYRMSEISTHQIGEASSVKTVVYGQTKFVEISLGSSVTNVVAKQIVICAPSEGLCDQVCLALHKAIKTMSQVQTRMHQSVDNSHLYIVDGLRKPDTCNELSDYTRKQCVLVESLQNEAITGQVLDWAIIQGGGTFEMFTENFLNKVLDKTTDNMLKMACEVVKGAVSEVPQVLHRNLNHKSVGSADRSFLTLHKHGCEKLAQGECLGFDSRDGELRRLESVLEPISCKMSALLKALQLVCQILRTDSIVGVKNTSSISSK